MHMIILSLHLLAASIVSISILGVFIAGYKQRESKAYLTMLSSFAATAVSGVVLLFVVGQGLGRFCAMMSAYTIVVAAARLYYQKQTSRVSPL